MKLPAVVGTDHRITLTSGEKARVVLLNNAATTPPFEKTLREVNSFLQIYGALHRGAGPHANITYNKVQESIQTIGRFLNLRDDQGLLFTRNATSAINLFARMLRLSKRDVVITSPIEHTSNNLPWHYNTLAKIAEVEAFDDGSIDYDDLAEKAKKYRRHLKVIALNGASNTNGCIPDFQKLSGIARRHAALLFIDAAQLAPHREIDMVREGIDGMAFSAHKLYAPFGVGVLVLPKKMLESDPADPGGGSVDMVAEKEVLWMAPQFRHQSGTWNATGIVALAASCRAIMDATWKAVTEYERDLTHYMAKKLSAVKELTLHVPGEKYLTENRTGTFPFKLEGFHHAHLAAILEHEYGIETRAGAICNHRLVRRWNDVSDKDQKSIENRMAAGNKLASYGIVRASLGIHNTREDIDLLAGALSRIAKEGPKIKYREVPEEETFFPL